MNVKNTIDIKAEFFLKNCECLIEKPTTCVCIVNINECIPPRNIGYTLAFFSIYLLYLSIIKCFQIGMI